MQMRMIVASVLLPIALAGCADEEQVAAAQAVGAQGGASGAAGAAAVAGQGGVVAVREGVLVVAPTAGDPINERILAQLEGYLSRVSGLPVTTLRLPASGGLAALDDVAVRASAPLVVVLDAQAFDPPKLAAQSVEALSDDGFALITEERGSYADSVGAEEPGATFVYLGARTRLSRQYAAYELLRRLGVRFYHPEQEHVPRVPVSQLRQRARTPTIVANGESVVYQPDFSHRAYTFHGAHPLEHLEAFSDGRHPIDEAERVNLWIVKNRGNRFRGAGRGVAPPDAAQKRADELDALRRELGFVRSGGIGLHNQQQGASAQVDPSRPEPVQQQIEAVVEAQLGAGSDDVVEFGVHFGPTEFTTTPDDETLQWINWAGQKALSMKPSVRVLVNNHTTGGQPSQSHGDLGCPPGTNGEGRCDYYDLAYHTDPRLGVSVHTVMFYPLEGPAHVYDQVSFAHKLCLMQKASAEGRPLVYFPEGSWWLSFDNPIPVYLPLYIGARGRDIELVRPLLEKNGGTLYGHRMFNSGHEWGYWQQDYAVGLWHWNTALTQQQVLGELGDALCDPAVWPSSCEARDALVSVLGELIEHQREYLLERPRHQGKPGGLFTYLAGEDPADEIAASTGFEFRPVRTSFYPIAAWPKGEIAKFRAGDMRALDDMAEAHAEWAERLRAVRPRVPEAGLPWLDEVIDGVEINGLRARQAYQLYDAVVALREDTLRLEVDPQAPARDVRAKAKLAEAGVTLSSATEVIRRREKAYRYPAAQEFGGGVTPETAVPNGTTYPWRVHTKTHLLTYWTNRHEQARAIIESGGGASTELLFDPVFAAPGEPVSISWPTIEGATGKLSLGDGATATEQTTSHDYPDGERLFAIAGSLSLSSTEVPVAGAVVRASARARSKASGFSLQQPDSDVAREVLTSLAPGFRWAHVASQPPLLALAPETRQDGKIDFTRVSWATVATSEASLLTTAPMSFALPISPPSGGAVTLSVRVEQTVARAQLTGGALGPQISLEGQMVLGDIVDALIALAGFEEKGALQTLSGIIGFDPSAPPATFPFAATFEVTPE